MHPYRTRNIPDLYIYIYISVMLLECLKFKRYTWDSIYVCIIYIYTYMEKESRLALQHSYEAFLKNGPKNHGVSILKWSN